MAVGWRFEGSRTLMLRPPGWGALPRSGHGRSPDLGAALIHECVLRGARIERPPPPLGFVGKAVNLRHAGRHLAEARGEKWPR